MIKWLVTAEGGPTGLAYAVGWGGAIAVAAILLRLQQIGFGWRNAGRHSCGHVDRGAYHEVLEVRCQNCGGTTGWKAVTYRAKFFGTEVR